MIVKPLILTIGVCLAYELQCPLPAQWNIKARALCSDPSKYYCLPDDIAKELTENCTRSDYRRAGLRIVIRGDWDIDYCSDDLYQPAPIVYYTNLTSDCIMKKSLCNEEGQVLYKNGSPSDDVSCTCDHTNGYAFIEKPKQLHNCVPSQEDCSCYRKACQNDSYVLNSDFECILSEIDQVQHSPPTTAKILIERPARQNENNYIINYEQEYALLKCIKVIILVTLLIGGGFLIAICFFDEELYSFIESCEVFLFLSKDVDVKTVFKGEDVSFGIWTRIKSDVKWDKESVMMNNNDRVSILSTGYRHYLQISNASDDDVGEYQVEIGCVMCRCMKYRYLIRTATLRIHEYFTNILSMVGCNEGEDAIIGCEVFEDGIYSKWTINNTEIENSTKYNIIDIGRLHKLRIINASVGDAGQYIVDINGRKRSIQLHVQEYFTMNLGPEECTEGEDAIFQCEVSEDGKQARWNKEDEYITESSKYEIEDTGRSHKLKIKNVKMEDAGKYFVEIDGRTRSTDLSVKDQPRTIFTMSFRLNENWQPTYADNNSSEYKELIARVNDDFIRLYREDNFYKSNFRDFEVRCVRSGSIHVESIVSMKMAILTKDMYQDTLNLLKAEQAKPDSTLTIISAVITDSLVVIGHNDKPSTAFESEEGSLPMYTDEKNSEYKDLSEKIEKDYPLTEQKIGLLVDTVDELHIALIDLLDEYAERARRKSRDLLDEELRLVIVGRNGVGKRTTANTIMGKNHFPAGSLHTSVTQKCTQGYTTVIGKPMQVIVTPGIFAFKDKEKEIEAEIKRCIHMAAPGPNAILLVIEYGHFTSEDYDLIETFLEYFGEELMEYVIIVFSHIDKMESSHTLEKMIDEDPRLKQLIKECGNRYCKINNMGNSPETQGQIACIFAMIKAFHYTDHMIQKAEKNVREKEKKLTENIIKDGQKMYPEVIRELKKKFKTESKQENNYMNEYERLKEEIQAEYEQKLIQVREHVRKEFEKSTSVLADLNW